MNNDAVLVGCEHEFEVFGDDGPADFRKLIGGLGTGLAHLDPGDLRARRLPSGAVLTADGREAEIALPPTECRPGFTRVVAALATAERAALQNYLPGSLRLEGYSTHISVGVPCANNRRLSLMLARSVAPALMLLMDRRSSPGLLVRPRPNRLEFGGEYVDGIRLRAAVALATGGVLACTVTPPRRSARWPKLRLRLALDDHRYGWYVDRRAFGPDLYRDGRNARLELASGGYITAQEQLEACWAGAREALALVAGPEDLDPVDRVIRGTVPLPTENSDFQQDDPRTDFDPRQNSYGHALDPRHRPRFAVAPVMVTWHVCVFVIVDSGCERRAFACVPGCALESFLDGLDSGRLDKAIENHLRHPPKQRLLHRRAQTVEYGLYDELGPRWKLLPTEYDPGYQRRWRLLIARRLAPRNKGAVHAVLPRWLVAGKRAA